jgi:hypothetical protein
MTCSQDTFPFFKDASALGSIRRRCFHAIHRREYQAECQKRWHGDPLLDASGNWRLWQELHSDLRSAMLQFKRNPCMVDLCGETHADGTLTDFLWKLQDAWQPDPGRLDPLLDFCEHYQRVFLRRGLLIYCTMLLRAIEAEAAH